MRAGKSVSLRLGHFLSVMWSIRPNTGDSNGPQKASNNAAGLFFLATLSAGFRDNVILTNPSDFSFDFTFLLEFFYGPVLRTDVLRIFIVVLVIFLHLLLVFFILLASEEY